MNSKRTVLIAVLSAAITTLLIGASFLPLAKQAAAQPYAGAPSLISYQGYLTNGSGAPIDGAADLRIGIYATQDTTTYLWQQDFDAVNVDDGYFTIELPLTPSLFNGTERWLQITLVEGSTYTELPRQRISSVPFALQAANANTLDDLDSTDFALAGHTHDSGLTVYTDSSQWPILISTPKNAGNYSYPLANYGVPSGVKAVLVELLCQWSSPPGVCYIKLTEGGATTLNVNHGDVVATALVPIVNDTLYVKINDNTTETSLKIFGYIE